MGLFNVFKKKKEVKKTEIKRSEAVTKKVEEEPKIEEKPKYHHMSFSVAGVTFKSGRKSRQAMLRKIKFKDEPFDEIRSFEFEPYDFEGEQAYGIVVNGEIIGNVPRAKIAEFEKYNGKPLTLTNLKITGGGDYTYGCNITLKFDLI